MEETKKVESHKRAMYRAMCKDNLDGICTKHSKHRYKAILYNGDHPVYESEFQGSVTIACTAYTPCPRMLMYDIENPEKYEDKNRRTKRR